MTFLEVADIYVLITRVKERFTARVRHEQCILPRVRSDCIPTVKNGIKRDRKRLREVTALWKEIRRTLDMVACPVTVDFEAAWPDWLTRDGKVRRPWTKE